MKWQQLEEIFGPLNQPEDAIAMPFVCGTTKSIWAKPSPLTMIAHDSELWEEKYGNVSMSPHKMVGWKQPYTDSSFLFSSSSYLNIPSLSLSSTTHLLTPPHISMSLSPPYLIIKLNFRCLPNIGNPIMRASPLQGMFSIIIISRSYIHSQFMNISMKKYIWWLL